jgi:hypothetical protein
MSQAAQNIAASTAADKAEAIVGAAMNAATARKKASKPQPAQTPARRDFAARQVITLASAGMLAPTADKMAHLSRLFGIEPVDVDGIHDSTFRTLILQADELRASLSDRAMDMHFQRIVGAYVGSAYGAAQFYDGKRAIARDLASKLNDERDEDREGPSGFESRVERAQMFAAEMARQSFTLLAAAEGAVKAYAEITGNEWKPYVASTPDSQGVTRQAAAARAAAFD